MPSNIEQGSHVVVIGAGIAGLSSAWFLRRLGYQVSVVYAGSHVADGTSAQSGGHISSSESAPWTGSGFIRALRDSGPNKPVFCAPDLDPKTRRSLNMLRRFAQAESHQTSFARNLKLAQYTTRKMASLANELNDDDHRSEQIHHNRLEFNNRQSGIIRIFSTKDEVATAKESLDFFDNNGVQTEMLDPEQLKSHVPALRGVVNSGAIVGSCLCRSDQTGDVAALCRVLRHYLVDSGAEFFSHTRVKKIAWEISSSELIPRVRGIEIESASTKIGQAGIDNPHDGVIGADALVIAAGTGSAELLADTSEGADLADSLMPIKGYSLTYNTPNDLDLPKPGITWASRRLVYSNLGSTLRFAGLMDIGDLTPEIHPSRIATLESSAHEMFSDIHLGSPVRAWSGLRPMSVDGSPIIGRIGESGSNLFANFGHGPMGFTLGIGSGALLSLAVSGNHDDDLLKLFTPNRFFP